MKTHPVTDPRYLDKSGAALAGPSQERGAIRKMVKMVDAIGANLDRSAAVLERLEAKLGAIR